METSSLLHDITLLERKLHGIITQRECLGVNTREAEETEGAIKKSLADKKQRLRTIMESGEPVRPRQPAFIKDGVSLEMLHQIVEMEDKLCSILPVIETKPVDPNIFATLAGPTVVSDAPDDGAPNSLSHPSTTPLGLPPRFAACSVSTYPHVPGGAARVCCFSLIHFQPCSLHLVLFLVYIYSLYLLPLINTSIIITNTIYH